MPIIVMTLDAFSSMAIANALSMPKSTPFASRVASISPNASLTSHINLASHVDVYSMTMASSIFAFSTTTRSGNHLARRARLLAPNKRDRFAAAGRSSAPLARISNTYE